MVRYNSRRSREGRSIAKPPVTVYMNINFYDIPCIFAYRQSDSKIRFTHTHTGRYFPNIVDSNSGKPERGIGIKRCSRNFLDSNIFFLFVQQKVKNILLRVKSHTLKREMAEMQKRIMQRKRKYAKQNTPKPNEYQVKSKSI